MNRVPSALLAAVLLGSAVPVLAGCGGACTSYSYSVAADAQGAPSSGEALDRWLADAPDGFDHDRSAWIPTADAAAYSDGRGRIVVERVSGQGWFVTSADTCGG